MEDEAESMIDWNEFLGFFTRRGRPSKFNV